MTFAPDEKNLEAQRIADNMQKFAKKQFDIMYSKIKELEEQNQVRLDAINARDTQINYLQQINDEYEKKVKLLEKDVEYCWVIPNKNQIEKEATERINYLNKKSGWRGFIEGALWIQSALKIKPADSKDAVILQKEQQIQSLQEEIRTLNGTVKFYKQLEEGGQIEIESLREEMKKKDDGGRKTLIDFIQSIKDYTHESQNVIGFDEREAEEFVDIFLNNYSK